MHQQPFGRVYAWRLALVAALDIFVFLSAASVTWVTLSQPVAPSTYVALSAVACVLIFASASYCGLYALPTVGRAHKTIHGVLASMGLVAGGFGITYYWTPLPGGVLESAAHITALFYPMLLVERLIAHMALRAQPERILLVGTSDLSRALARALRSHAHIGIHCVGFLSGDPDEVGEILEGLPVLGTVDAVEKLADPAEIDRLVVASKDRHEPFPESALLRSKLSGIIVQSGISFYERVMGRIYMRDLRGSYLVFSEGFHVSRIGEWVKRATDFSCAGLGLVVASPFLLLAAAAIKLDSKGPVLFHQQRLGLDGRPFRIWKLRTMCHDAERNGAVWARPNDDRATRVGRWLRKIRLDEIPQLWNVLWGEMSLVGPRPERPEFASTLAEDYPFFWHRCAAKPGVTGWAQIHGEYAGSCEEWEEKLSLDLYYLKYRSLWLDLRILLDTVKTVVFMRGL